jgi:hypothetical protein
MKKAMFLLSVFAMIFSSATFAAWASWEDFNAYKDAKKTAATAESSGDTATAVTNYKKAADLAGKSATKDIQSWQLNSAAFVLIKSFKTLVSYDENLEKLTAMKASKEKIDFQKELAVKYSKNFGLLSDANGLLEQGKALDGGEEPEKMIQSNIDFIGWVAGFIKDNGGEIAADVSDAKKTTETANVK